MKQKIIHQEGLTLIEVLIALAVLAISLTAIVKATALDVRDTSYLRDKTIALWVANNSMAQVQLNLISQTSNHMEMTTKMLGQDWFWTSDISPTPNKYTSKLTITVRKKPEEKPLIVMSGFKPAPYE